MQDRFNLASRGKYCMRSLRPFVDGETFYSLLVESPAFPALVSDLIRAGAQVLVNVSNDGWLDLAGLGAAEQHLAIAAFRAVETRRYLARVASTGISGFIDPTGRPFALLAADTRGVTRGVVVPRDDVTIYVRCGDAFAFACVALGLVAVGVAVWRRAT